MALPAVRNLKTMIVGDPLTVAAPQKLAALWQKCPFVDQVIALDKPKIIAASAKKLRAGKFGSAVLLPNSFRAVAEAWLAGTPNASVMPGADAACFDPAHSRAGTQSRPAAQRYYYQDLDHRAGRSRDASLPGLRREAPTNGHGSRNDLAICPGAEYGPAKRWPVENFLAWPVHFVAKRQARIVLLGAPGERRPRGNSRKLPGVDNRVGKTSLAEFVGLASAQLVLCNDSGAMHVASALGVPTVAIFG